jgi:hypothetical protein
MIEFETASIKCVECGESTLVFYDLDVGEIDPSECDLCGMNFHLSFVCCPVDVGVMRREVRRCE